MEENSNLWYYAVVGAIYVLSRIFGKKKELPQPKPVVVSEEEEEEDYVPSAPKPIANKKFERTPTFEELLKELTQVEAPAYENRKPEPVFVEVPVVNPKMVDYQRYNIEEVKATEKVGISKHTLLQRNKPKHERSFNYTLEEENTEIRDGIDTMLASRTGLQQAFVIKELLDRKY